MKTIQELLEYGGPKMSKAEYMALKKKKTPVAESDFEPHMMYDPKTGKEYKAEKPEDHERMKKMGYTHEKPEIKEDVSTAIFGSMLLALAPFYVMAGKAMADDLKQLKTKSAKKGFKPSKEDQSLLQKFVAMVKRKKPDAVKNAKKKINEASNPYAKIGGSSKNPEVRKNLKKSIADLKKKTHGKSKKEELEEAKSSSGYELYHRDFSGAMQHAYAHAKKKGFIVDKDDVDHKVAMGPKRPSSGKTNKYILDTNKKQKLHVQVANLDNKRYELNMYIESVQLDESVISDVKDIVAKKQAKKIQGVMVDLFTASAISQIYDKVNDGNKAKMDKMKVTQLANAAMKLMKREDFVVENARAKRDAMAAMPKRGKDNADIDTDATDDDRKAASKNVLMQIRKASDLPKGGTIEFPDSGKKGKISQDDAKKVSKLFDMLKKPQDKQKFQKVISKDLKGIQALLKRLGR